MSVHSAVMLNTASSGWGGAKLVKSDPPSSFQGHGSSPMQEPSASPRQGMRHLLRPHPLVELRLGHEAELQRRLAQGEVLAMGGERDLRRLLVADVRS